mmetsp:Transcript_28172/g.61370  ORF Transcript_28172/g.61370 Transcript_28172/m.61370 type:complete len:267 (-) Transcript_28172:105-905(-)
MLRRRGQGNMSDHPEPSGEFSRDIETGDGAAAKSRDPLTMVAESTPLEKVVGVMAAAAVGTSLAAMVVQGGSIVLVAGILSCIVGPLAYWQQTRLTDIRTLQETHEAMKAEVDRLTVENDRLAKSVEELTTAVGKLEDTEKALDAITETQGKSVAAFADQVEQNKEILAKMNENLRANVLQNVISILIRSDTDGDFIIDDAEVDNLISRVEHLNGVDIHDANVRKVISDNKGDINALMVILKGVLNKEPEDRDSSLFSIKDEEAKQ